MSERLERRILDVLSDEQLSGFDLCQRLKLTNDEERSLYPLLFSLSSNGFLQVEVDDLGRRRYRVPPRPGKKRLRLRQGVTYA